MSGFTSYSLTPEINETSATEFLKAKHWPTGLIETLLRGVKIVPIRYFVCDDSGSMMMNDGNLLALNSNTQKYIYSNCSRWDEMTNSMKFHVELTRALNTTAEFRLLNVSAPIIVSNSDPEPSKRLLELFSNSPNGGTPLCKHLKEIAESIRLHESELRSNGQMASVVIATDGQASDGDVAEALRPFKNLPVWIVVRLCTNESSVVEYWNNVDKELELNLDILDDLESEAQEIHQCNPWFTYGLQLHRLREFGVPLKDLDILDESKLAKSQLSIVASLILGGRKETFPLPDAEFKEFVQEIQSRQIKLAQVWDPITKKMQPWIQINVLKKEYGSNGCACM